MLGVALAPKVKRILSGAARRSWGAALALKWNETHAFALFKSLLPDYKLEYNLTLEFLRNENSPWVSDWNAFKPWTVFQGFKNGKVRGCSFSFEPCDHLQTSPTRWLHSKCAGLNECVEEWPITYFSKINWGLRQHYVYIRYTWRKSPKIKQWQN